MANVVTRIFQSGFRELMGEWLNIAFSQINAAFNGQTNVTLSGSFNGTVGATTPARGAFTFADVSTATGLTAAGTTRADALALTKAVNVLGTVGSGTGVVLPSAATAGLGGSVIVFNDGSSPATVYGAGSDTIDGTPGSTGVTLTNALRCQFYVTAAATWKSAKLGATST